MGNGAEAWILFRASGTEPLLRVYCEAASPELVEEILASGEKICNATLKLIRPPPVVRSDDSPGLAFLSARR